MLGINLIVVTIASAKAHEEPSPSRKASLCCTVTFLVVTGALTGFYAAAICVWTPFMLIAFSCAVTAGKCGLS